jgi:L-alanine-DL-glutamate epimerase-like enolase superfamily enzyme
LVGRAELVIRALGLADVAMWDIAAQTAGQPL